jgi:hypothetical protein
MATPPAHLMLTKLRATARNAAWPARRPLSIELQAMTPEAGTLEASGTVSLDPTKVDVRARVAGAALAPYQGYIPFPMRVQGFVQLDLAIAASFGERMAVTARGTGALNDDVLDGPPIMRVRASDPGLDYRTTLTLASIRCGSAARASGSAPRRWRFRASALRAPEVSKTAASGSPPCRRWP